MGIISKMFCTKLLKCNQPPIYVLWEPDTEKINVLQITRSSFSPTSLVTAPYRSIHPAGLQEDGKMPLIDLCIWEDQVTREGGRLAKRKEWEVLWEYYRKPCAS